jgi:hypothetical protein
MTGSEAAIRVKSRKSLAENSMTSDLRLSSTSVAVADDRVGDQMRQVRVTASIES